MLWQHRVVGAALLAVLIGSPIAGLVCALTCDPAPAAHQSKCHEAAAADAARITGLGADGCGTHAVLGEASATIPQLRSVVAAIAAPAARAPAAALTPSEPMPAYVSPPGTAPPTARPLVLRV